MRVLDLGIWRPVPYATQLLAREGAEVVKVEPPGGDPMRAYPELYASLNEGKRRVTLDLKSDAGRAAVLDIVGASDAVVEGFRPGVADRLGVGWHDVHRANRRAVYCSLTGHDEGAVHDVNEQAWAGVLALEGDGAPRVPHVPWADLVGGLYAAFAITAAVARAAASGTGERVSVSMGHVLAEWVRASGPPRVEGVATAIDRVPGYGVFAVVDGHVTIGIVGEDHFWRALCEALGLDDAARLGFVERVARTDELQRRIAGALAPLTRDDAVATLARVGLPVAAVRTFDEVTTDRSER